MPSAAKPLLLVFPFGYLSHYLRCLVLSRHLAPSFDVRFAAHPLYDGLVQLEGFDTFPCARMDEHATLQYAKNFDFTWLNADSLSRSYTEQLRIITQMRPQAVLGDAQPALKMAAEKAGTPFIALMNGYMSKYFAGSRAISRTHPYYAWVRLLPHMVRARVTALGESIAMKKVHQPFAGIRRAQGLSRQQRFPDELEGDFNLICDLPQLFPQHSLPGNYRVTGPLNYEGQEHLGLQSRIDPTRKTLLVSMGSTGSWEQVSWLSGPGFREYNIITAGDQDGFVKGSHVIKTAFAAAAEVMPLADLVICQGGNGTIYQALSYGVPLLCSTVHFEQEWNAAALEKAGLGRCLNGISDLATRKSLVDGWCRKKKSPAFEQVMQEIAQYTAQLPQVLEEVCRKILRHD